MIIYLSLIIHESVSYSLDLEILIPQNHLSTIVHEAVIIYAYTQKVYSGRQMEKLLTENIYFMWLSGSQTPDFRTINRFRSERIKDTMRGLQKNTVEWGLLCVAHNCKKCRKR